VPGSEPDSCSSSSGELLPSPRPWPETGGSLLRSCQIAVRGLETGARGMTSADGYHIGYCFGMLQGVQESTAAHGTQYQETLFCAPQEVDRKELLHTFVTFLESNPLAQGLPSVAAVILAFQSAYPCR
jgi:hypothetical protein